MSTKAKEQDPKSAVDGAVKLSPKHEAAIREAVQKAQEDMREWRESSRVDPQKLKEPLSR